MQPRELAEIEASTRFDPVQVHPELAALLYAGDRFHARPRIVSALERMKLGTAM